MTGFGRAMKAAGVLGVAGLMLAACGGSKNAVGPGALADAPQADGASGRGFLVPGGEDGMQLISTDGGKGKEGTGIGVNSFLWRASLDTLSFMPLVSADPFGGVIITDWYTAPETPQERFKVQVYILDRRLRADGIRVNVFRQAQQANFGWVDAPVADDTKTQMENAILTKARQLRIDSGVK